MGSDLRLCTVCAANNNRSMEAHKQLQEAGFSPRSFGTGSSVKLPGPSIDKPNVYAFGTPYEDIYQELVSLEHRRMYEAQGLISMLLRNKLVKRAPEKWHNNATAGKFELVITCEERCFDLVIEDLMHRMNAKSDDADLVDVEQIVHVINIDIKDDNENAKIGGKGIVKLVRMIDDLKKSKQEKQEKQENALSEDDENSYPIIMEDEMMKVLTEWQKDHTHLPTLYTLSYY